MQCLMATPTSAPRLSNVWCSGEWAWSEGAWSYRFISWCREKISSPTSVHLSTYCSDVIHTITCTAGYSVTQYFCKLMKLNANVKSVLTVSIKYVFSTRSLYLRLHYIYYCLQKNFFFIQHVIYTEADQSVERVQSLSSGQLSLSRELLRL